MTQLRDRLATLLSGGLCCLLWTAGAMAQDGAPPAPATARAAEPTPWYVGASQGFTHETNVYRVPGSTGDTYSTTTVFGGFDQRIGRQRVFGDASVGLNRYFDEKQLDNTSYAFGLGLDWETVGGLSGDLDARWSQYLAAPAASAGIPATTLNLADSRSISAAARWGGSSVLTLEGTVRHSSLDYSDAAYVSSESSGNAGSLTLYYGKGGPLRLGIGARYDRTETPKAVFFPLTAEYESNTLTGRHVDFHADYDVSGRVTTNLLLSYTRQRNSLIEASDFSGLTGRLAVVWQATGRIAVNAYVSRESGFDSAFNSATFVPPGSPPGTPPVTQLYENNRLTYSADLGAVYSATAKIDVTAGGHYARAKVVSTTSDTVTVSSVESTDLQKMFYLSANYAFTRNGTAYCKVSRELRNVSGGVGYSYDANSIGCSVRYTYR